jgi:hypothetical protein
MNRSAAAVVLLFSSFLGISLAQEKSCPEADIKRIEIEAVTLRTWDALYNSYRTYKNCNDNAEADEGYSESIARILADHWSTLPRLAQLIDKDKSFARFVGLDATMDMRDVAKIRQNAITRCPVGLTKLCAKLKMDAEEAIAEDSTFRKQNNK